MTRFHLCLASTSAAFSIVAGGFMGGAALAALDGTALPAAIVVGATTVAAFALVKDGLSRWRSARAEPDEITDPEWSAAVAYQTLFAIRHAPPIDMAAPYADRLMSLREGTIDDALDGLAKAFPGIAGRLNGDDE